MNQGSMLFCLSAHLRVLVFCLLIGPVWANFVVAAGLQDSQPSPDVSGNSQAEVEPDNEKALRYHKALQTRPVAGYLFDRFQDAWLEESTVTELEKFLNDRASKTSATNDRLLLAFFFAKQGDDVRAIEQFRTALANDPSSSATYYEKAVIEARTLDFETALADLAQAAESKPDKELAIRIAQLQGSLYVRNRQNEEAARIWDQLVADNPSDEALMEDIIELQITEGLYAEAEALSDKLVGITQDPYQQVMRQLRKGDVLQRAGKQKEALGIYGETLKKVGLETWLEREVLAQIEELFRREDNLAGLSTHLTGMIAVEPNRLAIRKSAARLMLELGMTDDAIAAFTEIVELTPGDRGNREAFIGVLAASGRLETAIKQLQTLIEQNPADAELQMRLAELHQQNGQGNEAVAAIEAYLKTSGDTEYSFLRAARILDRFEQPARAKETFENCIAKHPDSETARESFAAWQYEHEDKPAAIAIWKNLADGGDRSQVVRIARILTSRQEHDEAYGLLFSRFEDFGNDEIFLGNLIDEAIALEKYQEALPWAKQRVRLANTTGNLESSIGQAVRVFEKGAAAESLVEEVRNESQESVPMTCLLAEMLELQGDRVGSGKVLDTAIAAINAAALNETDQAATHLQMLASQRIRIHMARQDWGAAAEATRAMIEMPGGRKSVNVRRLVELYLRDSQFESALTWIREWKQVSPGSLLPWINESRIQARMGHSDESLRTLRLASRKFPGDADLAAMLAQQFVENGQPRDAERIYWKQYEESEQLSDKLRWTEQLAELAGEMGSTDELVKTLEERRRNNPKSLEPLLAIAQAHRVADNYEERRKALLEATRLQPDSLPLLMEIARLEETEGAWESAIATLEQANRIDSSGQASRQMAKLFLEYGEPEKGLAILLELAGGENADARDIEFIVDAIVEMDDWERARDFLLPHTVRLPGDYRLKYMLAVIREELNETEPATDAFLELLSVEGRLPGVKAAGANTNPFMMQLQMVSRILPPSATEVLGLAFQSGNAYSFRDDPGGMSFMFGRSPGGSTITLPQDDVECRAYATCHLATMAMELDEERQQTLIRLMENNGVAQARLIATTGVSLELMYNHDSSMIKDFPGNEAVLAFGVMNAMNSDVESEFLVEAYQAFREKYVELAFMAAMFAATNDPAHEPVLDEAYESISNLEQPSEMIVSGIAQLIMDGRQRSNQLSEERIARLNGLMIKWYPSLRAKGNMGMGSYLFSLIMRSIQKNSPPERLIEFLDEEVEASLSSSTAAASVSMYNAYSGFSRQGPGGLVQLLPFPPTTFAHFPAHVIESLDGSENFIFGMDDGEPAGIDQSWIDRFGPVIDKAKNPMLRALLQLRVGIYASEKGKTGETDPFAQVRQSLETMMQTEPPELDAILFAASLATMERRWGEASELLDKSRNLPMSLGLRKTIDSALVANATAGLVVDLDKPENAAIVASAKSAALRLRRNRLESEQRAELLQTFETLGLKEEAEKLESKLVQGGPGNASPSIAMPGFSGNSSPDRVTELLDTGKSEAAIRLLGQQFSGMARSELNIDSMYENEYEWEEFLRTVRSLGVQEQLIAQLDPGESQTASKQAIQALAIELLGDKKQAIGVYQKSLEQNPKQLALRVRLAGLQLETDPSRILVHLNETPTKEIGKFCTALMSMLVRNEVTFETAFNTFERMIDYAEGHTGDESIDWEWLQGVAARVALQHSYEDGVVLQSIYQIRKNEADGKIAEVEKTADESEPLSEKEAADQAELEKRLAAAILRRDAVHQRICQVMLKIPSLTQAGFTSQLAATEARGETVGPEWAAIASEALLAFKAPRSSGFNAGGGMNYYPSSYDYYDRDDVGQATKRTPLDFLARHFGLAKDTATASQEIARIAEALQSGRRSDEADSLTALFSLYSAAENEFVAIAKKYVEKSTKSRRPDEDTSLSNVVGIWKDRAMAVDLGPFLIESAGFEKSSARNMGDESTTALSQYILALAAQKKFEEIDRFLASCSIGLLGPRDEQRDKLEKLAESQNTRRPNFNDMMKAQCYFQIIEGFCDNPDLVMLALEESNRLKWNQFGYQARSAIDSVIGRFRTADELFDWLDRTPFLKPIGEFQPFEGRADEDTVWGEVVSRISWAEHPWKAEAIKRLEEKPILNFGEGVFLAALKGEIDSSSIHELVGKELEAFQILDQDRKQSLASFVKQAIQRNQPFANSMSKLANEARTALANVRGDKAGEAIGKLMDAKKLSDIGVEYYNVDEWMTANLLPIRTSDPEKFVPALSKVLELIQKEMSGGFRGRGDSQMAASSLQQMLQTMVREDSGLDSIPVLLEVCSVPGLPLIGLDENLRQYLNRSLNAAMIQPGDGLMAGMQVLGLASEPPAERQVEHLIRQLGEKLGDRDTSMLLSAYVEILNQMGSLDSQFVLDRLEKKEVAAEWPQLAADWSIALQMATIRPDATSEEPEAGPKITRLEQPTAAQSRLLGIVTDQQRSLNWRVPVAMVLMNGDPTLPATGFWQCMALLEEGVRAEGVDQSDITRAMTQMIELADDAGFETGATSFAAAWKKTCLSASNHYGFVTENVLATIRFFHRLDQPAVISQLISRAEESAQNRAVVALLVELGQTSQAFSICRKMWSDPEAITRTGEPIFYTQKLHEGLPELLKLATNDGNRLLTEAMLASLPDPKVESERVEISRADRLNQLAAQFPNVSFSSKRNGQTVMILLADAGNAAEFIAAPLAEVASKLRTIELWDDSYRNSTQYEFNQRLLAAHVALGIRCGNLQPLHDLSTLLKSDKPKDEDNWSYHQAVGQIKNPIAKTILDNIDTIPPDRIREMLPMLRELNGTSSQSYYVGREFFPMLLVAHSVAGETEAFSEWARSNPGDGDSGSRGDLDDVWPVIADRIIETAAGDDAKRIAEVSTIWKLAKESGFGVGSGHFQEGIKESCSGCKDSKMGLDALVEAKLISAQEIATAGIELAKVNPVNGEIWRQVGHEQLSQKLFSEAVDSFRKSIANATDEMGQAKSNRMVEYAYALKLAGQPDEAKSQLKKVDAGKLLGANVQRFQALKSELGE